ncbi:acetylornithine aminotransferase [Fistulina hepatica ATCC 64428]|uniref:Acetylornithine aminotransferase n=1 Tax=Fistulina hepatica ATCC 64428 TaxID=1128425 RepID=A0A0D7AEQ3_9AGAR|nr:acetylornithine aminotransferase [Fistulina hepatica ATCC 64428]
MPIQPTRAASSSAHAALEAIGDTHVTHGLSRITPGIMLKGEGLYATFSDGRRMLDFTSGIGVTSLGHCHPCVSQAAADQCMKVVHAQCSIAYHEPYLQLIERLLPIMPDKSLDSFFFWNSGSEAIEAAIKIARTYTRRQSIVCMQGGYHGRTYGAMAVTKSKTIYSQGVFPIMSGTYVTPFPYWHQMGLPRDTSEEVLVEQCLYQLDLVLTQQTSPQDTAGILIEPVLGEGGYVPAPAALLKGIRERCDKYGIVMIIDEVQSGFATDEYVQYFAIEHSGVVPDVMTIAKGLANGFPLSGVVSRKEITDTLSPGSMGGTYAGNAVACAAAVAVADVMRETDILSNVNTRAEQLYTGLNTLAADPAIAPYVLEVRGKGLMAAIEFVRSGDNSDTALKGMQVPNSPKGIASRIAKCCINKGMLILTTSVYETIRFIPALTVSEAEMAEAIEIFSDAVREEIANS